MATKTIVIKIKDTFFLQKTIFNPNPIQNPILNRITLGSSFFNSININTIYGLYAAIDRVGSIQVFNDLVTYLNNLPNKPKLIHLFAIISSTSVVNLMRKAKLRTSYIGENLLNFYYMDVDIDNPPALMKIIDELKAFPGVDYVYVRGGLSNIEIQSNEPLFGVVENFTPIENIPPAPSTEKKAEIIPEINNKIANKLPEAKIDEFEVIKTDEHINQNKSILPLPLSINDKIKSLFDYCKVPIRDVDKTYILIKNKITVVDFERGWGNIQNDSSYSQLVPNTTTSSMILGGSYNHQSYKVHGQKTLNILFGKEILPKLASQIEGLCKGAIGKIASAWFGPNVADKQPEPALVKTLVHPSIIEGDIVLLEVQLDRWGKNDLPVEIESAMYAVIKAGVQAGYIIIEAAGNRSHDLDRLTPANILHISQTNATMTTENPPVDLSLNNKGTGSIVVGGRNADFTINNTILNHGNRVDYYCFAESSLISSTSTLQGNNTFGATSMASAITAALVARFQNEALNVIGRRLTITEIKILLGSIPYPETPTPLPTTPTSFQHFLSSRSIPNVLPPLNTLTP